jgi:hypothetical protein
VLKPRTEILDLVVFTYEVRTFHRQERELAKNGLPAIAKHAYIPGRDNKCVRIVHGREQVSHRFITFALGDDGLESKISIYRGI